MPKYIKKKDLKNAIDECTWYHIGKGGELVKGANSSEHEPLYKYSDIKEIIKNLPTRKFETEPKRTALSKALKWTYGDEPSDSEKPNNCETWHGDCKTCEWHDGTGCGIPCCDYEPKTEPQIRCPRCGKTAYIRNLEKDFGVKDSNYKYKCINCNTYIRDEPLDKDTNVRSKPNDCKYAVNPSGDVWECGCCLEIFCEHQIYDRNPDGTLNIVECGFEPKTEPQTERSEQ